MLETAHEKLKDSMAAKDDELTEVRSKLDEKKGRIHTLEHDVAAKGKSARDAKKTLKETSKNLDVATSRVETLEKELKKKAMEVYKHKGDLRLKQAKIDKMTVPKEDACISARSFSERHLISLRDGLIGAKEEQIKIINVTNKKIHSEIATLEAEIERLQNVVVDKSRAFEKSEEHNKRLIKKIGALERRLLAQEGHKEAIAVTTKQNMQLLALLQQEETKTQKLTAKLMGTTEDLERNTSALEKYKKSQQSMRLALSLVQNLPLKAKVTRMRSGRPGRAKNRF